jgi:hypothetical protein
MAQFPHVISSQLALAWFTPFSGKDGITWATRRPILLPLLFFILGKSDLSNPSVFHTVSSQSFSGQST